MTENAVLYRSATDAPNAGADSTATGFGPPDLSVLRQGRRPPPALPLDVFGPWADWIESAAEGAGSPVDYVAGPLLAAFSAMVGNARTVSPWDGWAEPAVLWLGSVGDPSSAKSPGADPVLMAVRAMERERAAGFDESHRRWSAEAEAAKAAHDTWKSAVQKAVKDCGTPPPLPHGAIMPPEPVRPRLVVNDATPESLSALLAQNPRGALHHRDELAGWLTSFERYSAGSSRAFWIEAYGARPFTIDRVKHGATPLHIPCLAVAICGGIQPDRLSGLLAEADDGLASRFLWIWPEPLPPRRPGRAASVSFIRNGFRRLLNLDMAILDGEPRPVTLRLDTDAADLLQEWREAHYRDASSAAGLLASAYGKLPGVVLRLALLLELAWWATSTSPEPSTVSRKALLAAVALVETYWKPMALRVYGDAALSKPERGAAALARWLVRERPARINAREIRRSVGLPELREAADMRAAIAVLEEANWLRPDSVRDGDKPGRRRQDYLVNPVALQGSAK